jgi:ATP-dependent DNA helicase RecQ
VRLAAAGATAGVDAALRELLREWRQAVAKKREVPAFVVMHDTSLDELCRTKPASLRELRQVHGFGEKKTADYGPQILAVLAQYRRGASA